MVLLALAVELGLTQLTPTRAETSNQYFPDARVPLVHEVPLTPVATAEKPLVAEVVDSQIV
jgi:hypothetical protein